MSDGKKCKVWTLCGIIDTNFGKRGGGEEGRRVLKKNSKKLQTRLFQKMGDTSTMYTISNIPNFNFLVQFERKGRGGRYAWKKLGTIRKHTKFRFSSSIWRRIYIPSMCSGVSILNLFGKLRGARKIFLEMTLNKRE